MMCKLLETFILSPDEQFFDYRQYQAEKSDMESVITNVKIDLRTETINKGSSHTLRII